MKCVICKQGKTHKGTATVTLEREGTTFIVKSVPAQVCEICGEEYIEEKVMVRVMQQAEEAVRCGVQVGIREYAAI